MQKCEWLLDDVKGKQFQTSQTRYRIGEVMGAIIAAINDARMD
jgi:hypothetical protein